MKPDFDTPLDVALSDGHVPTHWTAPYGQFLSFSSLLFLNYSGLVPCNISCIHIKKFTHLWLNVSQAWDTDFGRKMEKNKPKPLFRDDLELQQPPNRNVPRFSDHPRDTGKYSTCLRNSGSRRSSPTWFAQSLELWSVSMHTDFGILAILFTRVLA